MATLTTQADRTRSEAEIKDGVALLHLARGWLKQGNPVVAFELLKSAIESSEAEQSVTLRAQILKETGRSRMMQSDWTGSDADYLEAQRLALDSGDLKTAAECARNRANMCFQQGQYAQAGDLCERALEWVSTLNDHELRATIFNTMAATKSATGDLKEALKMFRLCLADFQTAGNTIRQGYVLLNIGLTQVEMREYPEAVTSLNEALTIALSERDLNLVEICYQNISKCYLAQNETHLAKSVIDTARRILPGLNSKALEAELNLIDCRILRAIGNFKKAEELLELTYEMAESHQMTALLADVLQEQGFLFKELGRHEMALAALHSAGRQYRQIGADKSYQETIKEIEHLQKRVKQSRA